MLSSLWRSNKEHPTSLPRFRKINKTEGRPTEIKMSILLLATAKLEDLA